MMAAMVGVLWAYDGWTNASLARRGDRRPGTERPAERLIGGVFVLIALYLGMTLVYHLVLPLDEIASRRTFTKGSPAGSSPPRTAIATCSASKWGVTAISLVVMSSTFISLNGNAMSGPRAYFAMARDGLFPRGLCTIHPRFGTPANAIIAQAAWAVILMVAATTLLVIEPPKSGLPEPILQALKTLHEKPLYDVLFSYVIFGGTVFYGLSIVSVFFLRFQRPDLPRPYRTWGYPLTPVAYTAASLLLLTSMLQSDTVESLAGLAIIAAGIPAYLIFSRNPPPVEG